LLQHPLPLFQVYINLQQALMQFDKIFVLGISNNTEIKQKNTMMILNTFTTIEKIIIKSEEGRGNNNNMNNAKSDILGIHRSRKRVGLLIKFLHQARI